METSRGESGQWNQQYQYGERSLHELHSDELVATRLAGKKQILVTWYTHGCPFTSGWLINRGCIPNKPTKGE